MEFEALLQARRSIRVYKDEKVSKEVVVEVLKATTNAPSWKNSQTPRYHVVMSDEMLKEFKATCLPAFNAKNCANAPVLFVTTFKKDLSGYNPDGTPTNEVAQGWGYYDLGLANEILCLKAKELGLDTLIMGIRDEASIRSLLNIPEDEIIVAVISMGYRDIEPKMPNRKELDEIVKYY